MLVRQFWSKSTSRWLFAAVFSPSGATLTEGLIQYPLCVPVGRIFNAVEGQESSDRDVRIIIAGNFAGAGVLLERVLKFSGSKFSAKFSTRIHRYSSIVCVQRPPIFKIPAQLLSS
jgi:hypothetical protein